MAVQIKVTFVNKIELEFFFFSCRANLVLAAPTKALANNIERSTIHTSL